MVNPGGYRSLSSQGDLTVLLAPLRGAVIVARSELLAKR